jgi:hypothetical protein
MQTLVTFPCDIWVLLSNEYPHAAYLNKNAAQKDQQKINGDRSPSDLGYCTLLQTKLYAASQDDF